MQSLVSKHVLKYKLHQRLKTTFIYVTHDQTEAMTMGDKIVVMKDGVIQQVASPQEIYDFPINMFVAGFIGSPQMNFIEGTLVDSDQTLFFQKSEDQLKLDADVVMDCVKRVTQEKVSHLGYDLRMLGLTMGRRKMV